MTGSGEDLAAGRTPLFSHLVEHSRARPLQFHIPGHKCGRGMDPEFRAFMGDDALSIDLINIAPLDDFHRPRGIIREAEELAAEAFGAEHTFFSVQGTSGAIMAMVMAVCQPGEKMIVPRNVHRSVISALMLSGAVPVFLQPEIDRQMGIAHGVSLDAVATALDTHPDARALLLVYPTYFGVCSDIKGIVELAHGRGIPVLVDEAHGAHLYFHPRLPVSAMEAGADAAATSMHKLCGSLTQSSILNLQGNLVSPERVRSILSLLTTTSTSYILLSSLDAARRHMAVQGNALLERTLALATYARAEINQIPGLSCFGEEMIGTRSSSYDWDPTKLCISVKKLGVSGVEIEQMLRDQFRIEVELSDLYNVLCVVTIGDTKDEIDHLLDALRQLAAGFRPVVGNSVYVPEIPEHVLALSPRQAFYADAERVPIEEAVGCAMTEFVLVYPPGIPLLVPGEIITADDVEYIRRHQALGYPIHGPEDEAIQYVRVVAAERSAGRSTEFSAKVSANSRR